MPTATVTMPAPVALAGFVRPEQRVNGYGCNVAPYQAQVTLEGGGTAPLTVTVPVTPDAWNNVHIDLTGWAP